MGIEGLGSRALEGRQGPGVAEKAASFDQLGFQVTPENVLVIYKAVAQEATRLNFVIQRFKNDNFEGMPLLGGDPISPYMKKGYDETTDQLTTKCQSDVDDLQKVADGLAAAAKSYGNSEDQIRAAFDPRNYRYVPMSVGVSR
jgi:hypothetical protein